MGESKYIKTSCKHNDNYIKVDSIYNLSKMVESLVLSGYCVSVKPVYRNEICVGPPTPSHYLLYYVKEGDYE